MDRDLYSGTVSVHCENYFHRYPMGPGTLNVQNGVSLVSMRYILHGESSATDGVGGDLFEGVAGLAKRAGEAAVTESARSYTKYSSRQVQETR